MNLTRRVVVVIGCLLLVLMAGCGADGPPANDLELPNSGGTTSSTVSATITVPAGVPATAPPTTIASVVSTTKPRPVTTRPVTAPAPPAVPAGPSFSLGQEFTLGFGEAKVAANDGLKVAFIQKVEDSRCPPDVQCVYAGNARVVFEASKAGSSSTLSLNTLLEPKSATFNGYTVTLRSLSPGSGAPDSSYRATLVVTRG